MAKPYRPWTPTQSYLLPPSPMDWLDCNDLVYFILDVLGELDLGKTHGGDSKKGSTGQSAL